MTEQSILTDAANFLDSRIKIEWEAQGHHMSGAWENSITHEMVSESEIAGLASAYGAIVNAGTKPDRIPYGGVPTGAKTSAYIQGLYNYFKAKGKTHKEAMSFAFATAKKQKKEGMSTVASRVYSSTGQRQHFLEAVIESIGKKLDEMVLGSLDNYINQESQEPLTLTI